jgi:hypothetical protein
MSKFANNKNTCPCKPTQNWLKKSKMCISNEGERKQLKFKNARNAAFLRIFMEVVFCRRKKTPACKIWKGKI